MTSSISKSLRANSGSSAVVLVTRKILAGQSLLWSLFFIALFFYIKAAERNPTSWGLGGLLGISGFSLAFAGIAVYLRSKLRRIAAPTVLLIFAYLVYGSQR